MSNTVNLRNISEKTDLAVLESEIPEISALLQVYPPEAAKNLLNNKEKLAKISIALANVTNYASVNTLIMKCADGCIYKDICILCQNEIAPFGYPCPVEKKIIIEMESDLVKSLEIDRNDPIEMEMLWDLIDTKLLDMRASGALKDGRLVQIVEQKVGQQVVTRNELAPELEIKLELKRLKHYIMDMFVATRRSKKKYGMNSDVNTLEQLILQAANNVNCKPNKD